MLKVVCSIYLMVKSTQICNVFSFVFFVTVSKTIVIVIKAAKLLTLDTKDDRKDTKCTTQHFQTSL